MESDKSYVWLACVILCLVCSLACVLACLGCSYAWRVRVNTCLACFCACALSVFTFLHCYLHCYLLALLAWLLWSNVLCASVLLCIVSSITLFALYNSIFQFQKILYRKISTFCYIEHIFYLYIDTSLKS